MGKVDAFVGSLLVLMACGGGERPPPAPPEPPPSRAAEPQTSSAEVTERSADPPAVQPTLRDDIGWATLPRLTPSAAKRANRAALRKHGHGDYEGSRDGFRAALEAYPAYANARFNLACALSRLGALGEAKAEMERLLLTDLPTFGPRYDEDEDMANLRSSPQGAELRSFRANVTRSYEAVMSAGPAVLRWLRRGDYEETTDYVQAGVWVPETRRFVPMGPRMRGHYDGTYRSVVATLFDARNRLTLLLRVRGDNSDYGHLDRFIARAVSAPDGVAIPSVRDRDEPFESQYEGDEPPPPSGFSGIVTEGGARWEFGLRRGHFLSPSAGARVLGMVYGHSLGFSAYRYPDPVEGVRVDDEHGRLRIGEGENARVVRLRGPHRNTRYMAAETQIARLGPDVLLMLTTHSSESTDGAEYGGLALSRVTESTGEISPVRRTQGAGRLTQSPNGDLYVEANGRMYRAPRSGELEPLPEGLVLAVD